MKLDKTVIGNVIRNAIWEDSSIVSDATPSQIKPDCDIIAEKVIHWIESRTPPISYDALKELTIGQMINTNWTMQEKETVIRALELIAAMDIREIK